jgi:hypothetical protein
MEDKREFDSIMPAYIGTEHGLSYGPRFSPRSLFLINLMAPVFAFAAPDCVHLHRFLHLPFISPALLPPVTVFTGLPGPQNFGHCRGVSERARWYYMRCAIKAF